jgi:hypothetical protein
MGLAIANALKDFPQILNVKKLAKQVYKWMDFSHYEDVWFSRGNGSPCPQVACFNFMALNGCFKDKLWYD